MLQVHRVYNVTNSHIFMCTCWFYCHCEASVRGHEILQLRRLKSLRTAHTIQYSGNLAILHALHWIQFTVEHFVLVSTVIPRHTQQ
jgi:hypothetical protein